METRIESLRSAHKRAAVIAISLMGSILVYVVVAELLHNLEPPWRGVAFTSDHRYYDYVRYGLLALGLIGALLAAKISTAVNFTPEKLTNPLPALLTHAVVLAAACDMLGTCGFVLFLMAGNMADVYIFGGLSLGLSVAFFPKFSRWKELAESWLSSPAAEPGEQKARVKATYWKPLIIIIAGVSLMFLANAFCRENALEEDYGPLLWAGLFPLVVIALLYLFYAVKPSWAPEGSKGLFWRASSPALKHLFSIFSSLFVGFFLIFSVRSALIASMDRLNEAPTQVESFISGVSFSKECRVKVYVAYKWSFCLQYRGHRPVQTPWPLEKMTADELYGLFGKRVILVGRKSFAGTVIDEIRLPPDKAIERTSSGITDHTR
jgi:hypothetical protein